jgi:hypothetical protein
MTERGLVQAECPTCGAVIAEASALACWVSEADEAGLCEFPCPTCDHRLLIPFSPRPSLNRRAVKPASFLPDNTATPAHTKSLGAATTAPVEEVVRLPADLSIA